MQMGSQQTDCFMGTLAYASPEQMDGCELDCRSAIRKMFGDVLRSVTYCSTYYGNGNADALQAGFYSPSTNSTATQFQNPNGFNQPQLPGNSVLQNPNPAPQNFQPMQPQFPNGR
jgi:serine/threonine protein kinase